MQKLWRCRAIGVTEAASASMHRSDESAGWTPGVDVSITVTVMTCQIEQRPILDGILYWSRASKLAVEEGRCNRRSTSHHMSMHSCSFPDCRYLVFVGWLDW